MMNFIFSIVASFILLCTSTAQDQWEIVNNSSFWVKGLGPNGNWDWTCLSLSDLHFVNQDKGYLVGGLYGFHYDYGALFKTEDGGRTWNIINDGGGLAAVHFISESNGFMLSCNWLKQPGNMLTSADSGYSWMVDSTSEGVKDICFVNDSSGYAVSWRGTGMPAILKTNNKGESWRIFHQPELEYHLNSIFFIDENNGWVLCDIFWGEEYQNNILKYTDELGWKEILSGIDLPLNKILFIDHDVGWISGGYSNDDGFKPVYLRSVDGGKKWAQTPGLDYVINDFYFENSNHGWAAGEDQKGRGRILETFDSGLHWEAVTDTLPARLNALHFADGYGWAVGDDGLLLKTKYTSTSVNRFMVVGDPHHYSPSPDFSQSMLHEMALAAIAEDVDFIFFTGDLVVRGFDTPEEEDAVLKDWRFVLDTLNFHNIKVYACRGNNDVFSRPAWDSLFSGTYSFPQNGPETEKNITYAAEYDNLLFIALDQYVDGHKINQVWLDSILSTTTSEHIFVAGHESAFKVSMTNCMGAFPEDRNLFWESLADAGVKAYFCAHDHFYDHAVIDDGDDNPDNDIHQVIVGTGGGSLRADAEYDGDNGRWTPERLFHEDSNGYVLVELKNDKVEMTWKHRIEPNVFEYGGDFYTFSTGTTSLKEIDQRNVDLINYPNPFHSRTLISYSLPASSNVEMCIYDLSGRKVTILVNEQQQAGMHEVEWNAEGMQPGIYFCELKTSQGSQVIKMIFTQL